MNQEEYDEAFSKHKKEALHVALDTRKFEIELYWKRATYFWTFIAVTFAGYGLVQRGSGDAFLSLFLSCFGFVLSLGWVLANRGSKQWQENWEHHVDHLEDDEIGPLFKTSLPRSKETEFFRRVGSVFIGPGRYSVSKINQLLSFYITIMWTVLVLRTILEKGDWTNIGLEHLVLALTFLATCSFFVLAKTHTGAHYHDADRRNSKISGGSS